MSRKILLAIIIGLGILGAGLLYLQTQLETSYLARYILWNQSDVSDKDLFPARVIENAPPVYQFMNRICVNSP